MSSQSWDQQVIDFYEKNMKYDMTYQESADLLKKFIKTGLLKYSDITNNPERFFHSHRILSIVCKKFVGYYNLFAGTIVGNGNPSQIKLLDQYEKDGTLGCFALTEVFAGVNSGLIVRSTATFNKNTQQFVLNSNSTGDNKNWISQGLTADKAIVVANLIIDDQNKGIHAFLIDLRQGGKLVKGVDIGDMAQKSAARDLDNVWINFKDVVIDKSCLLNKYADIVDNTYVCQKGIKNIEMIGQRLFTGRIALAQCALAFRIKVFDQTKLFSDKKQIWIPKGKGVLSDIPQLSDIYQQEMQSRKQLNLFTKNIESQLNICLRNNTIPSIQLIDAIAVAKVACIETSIEYVHRLRQEVGSYCLMDGTGFESADILQMCKFAEGDSRILMQKMVRDLLMSYMKGKLENDDSEQYQLISKLSEALAQDFEQLKDQNKSWNKNWKLIYQIADAHINKVTREFTTQNPKL